MKTCHNFCRIKGMPAVLFFLLLFLPAMALAKNDPFPNFNCIGPNVEFWKSIYARYSTAQGVVHDIYDLGVVYEVIDIEDSWETGARRRNEIKIEGVKEKYAKILEQLAQDRNAQTEDAQRVRALFGDKVTPERFQEAAKNIRLQVGQKNRFREGVVRSGAYFDEIKNIIKSYDLPEDIAYLPHVESSFNYKAYSKSGAAGIWQFTNMTGKRFMTINYALDERRDPILATHAAAKLLKENYSKLGCWALALTAYNHGTSGMMKAKHSKGDYETIFKEYEGSLFKFASRNFYSEFLAARDVARNYDKHFGQLTLEAPVQSRAVEVKGYTKVDDLLAHLKLDMATFRELNPGLRDPVYSGQKYIPKGYQVRVPERENVIKMAAKLPDSLYKEDQKSSNIYQVRKGETAGTIAKMHGIKLQDLVQANQLGAGAMVYVGQNLRIPKQDAKITVAASDEKKPPVTIEASGEKKPPATITASAEKRQPVTIEASGEKKQPVTMAASGEKKQPAPLQVASLTSPPVAPEEKAEVAGDLPAGGEGAGKGADNATAKTPSADGAKSPSEKTREKEQPAAVSSPPPVAAQMPDQPKVAAASPPASAPAVVPAAENQVPAAPENINPTVVVGNLLVEKLVKKKGKMEGVIRVEAEETIGHYAEWLGVSAQELRRLNGLRAGDTIRMQQQIKIPLSKVSKEKFEEIRYEYHKEMEEDFFAAYRIESVRPYKIKNGDNIWALCQNEFEVPFWLIRKYNENLNWDGLQPEQQLMIPVIVQQLS